MDAVAQGYLAGINDKYADYLSAEGYPNTLRQRRHRIRRRHLGYDGKHGYMQVTQVYEGSAAAGAGIQPGDLINKIDDIDITADTFDAASELLTGDAARRSR
jgi:carboxyl-terminal processing protease